MFLGGCPCCGPCWRCYTDETNYECVGPDDTPKDGWTPVGDCHKTEEECAKQCGPWRCYGKLNMEVCEAQGIAATIKVVSVTATNTLFAIDTSPETGLPPEAVLTIDSITTDAEDCQFTFSYRSPITTDCFAGGFAATGLSLYVKISRNADSIAVRGTSTGGSIISMETEPTCGLIAQDPKQLSGFGKHPFTAKVVNIDSPNVEYGIIAYEINVIDMSVDEPDIPAGEYDYQCFDAPPDEDGWLPIGKSHATEEECAKECGPWRCYGTPMPQDDPCPCDGSQMIWPASVQGGLSYDSFELLGGFEDPGGVANFLNKYKQKLTIPFSSSGSSGIGYNLAEGSWPSPGGIDFAIISILFHHCTDEVSFSNQTPGGIKLAEEYIPLDGSLPPGLISYYGGSISMQVGQNPRPTYQKCVEEDPNNLTIRLAMPEARLNIRFAYLYLPGGSNQPVARFEESEYRVTDVQYSFGLTIEKENEIEDQQKFLDHQCFDAPPDEDGWTPVGGTHADKETCHAACPPTTPPLGGRTMPTTTTGPGTHLKNMLAAWGIHAKKGGGCKCRDWEVKMNRWGADCRQHMDAIVDHLQAEAKKRNLPFVRKAGEMLVKRAIKRFEKES